ncbi:MAG: hypothetical protein D6800_05915 [Candidatus Zixiibacteriota bacterium]|nr:MAG: hypothetical protein D6800_05915 [candidate division Zixibacteria bacterium]
MGRKTTIVPGWLSYPFTLFLTLAVAAVLVGCTATSGPRVGSEEGQGRKKKVPVEAYLFDARFWRDKKPTSFRLEVYYTDSVVGLAGRGYLGKGVLKGRLTRDSLLCYFPVSGEYLYESVPDAFAGLPCDVVRPTVVLTDLFTMLPENLPWASEVVITPVKEKAKRREYRLTAPGCYWMLTVTYDKRKPGWRIRRLEYTDGAHSRLRLIRREYRRRVRVSPRRLLVTVPPGVLRVTP